MPEHLGAHIGDDAFPQPVDEVEPGGAGDRQHEADHDQHRKVAADQHVILDQEAEVDHAPHGDRNRKHGERGNDQRQNRKRQHAGIGEDMRPQHQEGTQRTNPRCPGPGRSLPLVRVALHLRVTGWHPSLTP